MREPSREQITEAAGREFDQLPVIQTLGFNREQWITARLMGLGMGQVIGGVKMSWFGHPSVSGEAKMSSDQQNAVFAAEFDASPDVYAEMGLTKEQYIQSRRVDVGLSQVALPTQQSVRPANTKAVDLASPENKAFVAEFDATPDIYANMGLTKEQYVAGRRVDVGLDRLSMRKA